MSLATERMTLAAALNDVTGVVGYESMPIVVKTGDAWPLIDHIELVDGLAWQANWLIRVVLPSDVRSADAWVTDHFIDIAVALRARGFAEQAEIVDITSNTGDISVLQIRVKGE